MRRLYSTPDDFEGVVRILAEREGGRRVPPQNGIRWDLRYFHDGVGQCWMIWPEFTDEAGDAFPADHPITGLVHARFYVIAPEMRPFHLQQARPGVGFFCVEGAKVCAAGIITRVTGLDDDDSARSLAPR